MSVRTILEINHNALREAAEDAPTLIDMMAHASIGVLRNVCRMGNGIRVLGQLVHSPADPLMLTDKYVPSKEAIKAFEKEGGKFSYTAWSAMMKQIIEEEA